MGLKLAVHGWDPGQLDKRCTFPLGAFFLPSMGIPSRVMTASAHIFYSRGRMLSFKSIIDLVGMLKFCSIHMNYGSLRFLWWLVRVAHRLHLFLAPALFTEFLDCMYFYELSTEASDIGSGSPYNCQLTPDGRQNLASGSVA